MLRHRQTVFVLLECCSDILPSNIFYTSASDRLGSQKGYPQRRWFKIAALTKRALLSSLSFPTALTRWHRRCWTLSLCTHGSQASRLLGPLLLGHRAPPLCLLSPPASPYASGALSCCHTDDGVEKLTPVFANPAQSSLVPRHPPCKPGPRRGT